jgi:hypothetical protein
MSAVFSLKEVKEFNKLFSEENNVYLRLMWAFHQAQIYGKDAFVKSIPLEFIGDHAISKSSLVRKYAEMIGAKIYVFSLGGVQDLCEIAGMKHIIPDPTSEHGVTVAHIAPQNWPKQNERAIILWDDFRRAMPFVMNGAMSLLEAKNWNGAIIPEGVAQFITSNPPDQGFSGMDLDAAQNTRMVTIGYNPNADQFLNFALEQNAHTDCQTYFQVNKTMLQPTFTKREDPTVQSLKAWRLNGMLMRVYPYIMHDTEMLNLVLTAIYGVGAYEEFMRIKNGDKLLTLEDVLSDYKEVNKQLHVWLDSKSAAQDMVFASIDSITRSFVAEVKNLSCAQTKIICDWIVDLPKDYQREVFVAVRQSKGSAKLTNSEGQLMFDEMLKYHKQFILDMSNDLALMYKNFG